MTIPQIRFKSDCSKREFLTSKWLIIENTFHLGKQTKKNVIGGEIGRIGRVWHGSHVVFGQKLLNTPCGVGRCTCESPFMKCWKSLPKNSLKVHAASYNAKWYTDTDGFLEHSPSGGSLYYTGPILQKIILFWGIPPHIYIWNKIYLIFITVISLGSLKENAFGSSLCCCIQINRWSKII